MTRRHRLVTGTDPTPTESSPVFLDGTRRIAHRGETSVGRPNQSVQHGLLTASVCATECYRLTLPIKTLVLYAY